MNMHMSRLVKLANRGSDHPSASRISRVRLLLLCFATIVLSAPSLHSEVSCPSCSVDCVQNDGPDVFAGTTTSPAGPPQIQNIRTANCPWEDWHTPGTNYTHQIADEVTPIMVTSRWDFTRNCDEPAYTCNFCTPAVHSCFRTSSSNSTQTTTVNITECPTNPNPVI